jgi:hypothetical protein
MKHIEQPDRPYFKKTDMSESLYESIVAELWDNELLKAIHLLSLSWIELGILIQHRYPLGH